MCFEIYEPFSKAYDAHHNVWMRNCVNITESAGLSGLPGGGGVSNPLPPKFRSFDKAELYSQFCGKYMRNNQVKIRVLFIWKLNGTPD
jgi:hypothetical protein